MALFTIVLDYGGGTYISQLQARTAKAALAKWAEGESTVPVHGLGPTGRRDLSKALSSTALGELVKLDGLKNAWWNSSVVRGKPALISVIETAV